MSHEATRWAFAQRGLTPAQKILLLCLADCHNPAHGCFPTQEYLSEACEMGERTVRDHLIALEERGLISRERMINEYGHRTGTRYVLGFEVQPAKSAAREKPTGKNTSAYRQKHVEPTGNCLPVDIDEPVIEPVKEPVSNPIVPFQAIRGEIVTPFDDFWRAYPKKVSKADARKAFDRAVRKTSPPEIMAGLERAVRSDQRFRTRQYTPNPATWINDEGWTDEHPTNDLHAGANQGRSVETYILAAQAVANRRGAGSG